MSSSPALTVRLTPEITDQLARLSDTAKRTPSVLAAEAIGAYVAREIRIVEGIERGLSDMNAGRLVSHEDAMAEIDAMIEMAERGRE